MAWMGELSAVLSFLQNVGADTTEGGDYKVARAEVTVGIGGKEVVVPPETVYFLNGKAMPLAEALRKGGSGICVRAF